jgi:quercetin dioxygenase-like cupin family protein
MKFAAALLCGLGLCCSSLAKNAPPAVHSEVLTQTTKSWDGAEYSTYPKDQPQLSVLKITIPANTTMKWHTHPVPNAAYVLSGEITVETQAGVKRHFVAGQVIPETVNTVHRGVTGKDAVQLIVFYAGTVSMPLSQEASPTATR